MKNSYIKTLSINDLIKKIKIYEEDYQKIKFDHCLKMYKNPMEIRFLRKNIAKLKTELNKKNKL
ncbi:50S ribosomal protein L29 [Blattabacterium cuenoti]|uniref:50S ribosomal protein L29 n=1 Tax=Blattabacterium cuenoti TaxID=1653831 RepID=UPI00163BB55B|nr:50S ribosomal protein L29 [Blattabacterium cuenoti]